MTCFCEGGRGGGRWENSDSYLEMMEREMERERTNLISCTPFCSPAATGLLCALYALLRSMLSAAVIWPLGYAAFSTLQV